MILYSDTVGNFINSCQGPNPVIGQLLLYKFKAQHIGGGSNSEYNSWIHSLPKVAEALKDNAIPKEAGVGVEYKLIDTKQRVDFLIFGNDNENNENVILIELKRIGFKHLCACAEARTLGRLRGKLGNKAARKHAKTARST